MKKQKKALSKKNKKETKRRIAQLKRSAKRTQKAKDKHEKISGAKQTAIDTLKERAKEYETKRRNMGLVSPSKLPTIQDR